MRILQHTVTGEEAGMNVKELIARHFALVSHDLAAAKYDIPSGITLSGITVRVNAVAKEGDLLRVLIDDRPSANIYPYPGSIDIIYEDEDIVVVNKPAGKVVHPSAGHFKDTIANHLADHYIKSGQPHEVRTVGRLDKDTSGLVVFAKSRTAVAHLVSDGQNDPGKKEYLALAEGTFEGETGVIEAPISRDYTDKFMRYITPEGQYAHTEYRVLRRYGSSTLLSVRISTGRTHQIRLHMAHIGHPLVGDPIYGSGGENDRALLHAWHIAIKQPFTGERLCFESPVPEDMMRAIRDQGRAEEILQDTGMIG